MTRVSAPARLRLRRRLLIASAPVAAAVLALAAKLISVVVVGGAAQQHYVSGEIGSLRADVAVLRIADVLEPDTTAFAAGGLAVLEGRAREEQQRASLEVAEPEFSTVLAATDPAHSCPVRVNLELVRERQGDIEAWEARLDAARDRYESALTMIADAPAECFDGNNDPDPQRRAVRQDAQARLTAKIDALGTLVPPGVTPPPPPADLPPPAAPAITDPEPTQSPDGRRLDPTDGDPLEVLRRLLRDAAAD
ncbi:Uncharacterised protein [Mycolicibacterium vanbaalenii]|uniref:Uncharacterized protein n=1 Tax=Mycolicibacterium vanbaalenii TaxID=110539 RepID=A0A5S9PYY8_MYCVN|nr:hypothetical protein [Mycolicibacterium vanbaalenii]CAA0110233.1 Uncharacterised protein [Mycolicibacterium vanbaalenii]